MTLHDLSFSLEGRISRATFWVGFLVYIFVSTALYALGVVFIGLWQRPDEIHGPFWTLALVLGFLVAIIGELISLNWLFAIGTKRLHDREKSGAWMLTFMLSVWGLNIASELMDDKSWIGIGLSIAGYAFLVWALIELGLVRGTPGANQYGDDPLLPSAG